MPTTSTPTNTPSALVALETTLLAHGVPRDRALPLTRDLAEDVRASGAEPAVIGILDGRAVIGMSDRELERLVRAEPCEKANTANLGVLLHRGATAATTVSATMELAAGAGVRVFATGAIGGVHRGYAEHLDISSDLAAFTRFPVAVVTSGVKSLLDIESTREALETLGIPVVGYRADRFPAFYLRASDAGVDARFDDPDSLAAFVQAELDRTGRGVVIANPIPEADELDRDTFDRWLAAARDAAISSGVRGRSVTPAVLGALHEISGGATLRANIALVRANAKLAGEVAIRFR